MTEPAEMQAALEAVLFATAEPVPRQRLVEIFDEAERPQALAALEDLVRRYQARPGHGIVLEEVAGGLRLVTPPQLNGYLQRFFEASGRGRLSMAALETLAIVAYRQPITAPEVQALRGVNCGGVLKTLLDRRLVRISGRKQVVGKPFLYSTSRDFLVHFGLNRLDELPPLEELEEMLEVDGNVDLTPRDETPRESAETGVGRPASEEGGGAGDGAATPAVMSGDPEAE